MKGQREGGEPCMTKNKLQVTVGDPPASCTPKSKARIPAGVEG